MQSDDRDPNELPLSGPDDNSFLWLDAIIRFSRLTSGDIEHVVLFVILNIELLRFQHYARDTTSPLIFFG